LKLTQAAFGDRLGVSRSVVNNWERGVVEPTEMVIRHFHNTFNVREEWLRTGEGSMYEETAQDYVEQLIQELDLGPGGRFLMKTLLHAYERLGERETIKMIEEFVPMANEALAQSERDKILARWDGIESNAE
jgi:transcriptional regulator with XRE-family HTH domain